MAGRKGYVDPAYLESLAKFVRHLKQRSYELMRVAPGQRIADLGCGPASDTLALGALVGAAGRVIGIDNDPQMIAEAERRRLQADGALPVEHRLADARAMPFDDGHFDACRCERLFQHLAPPEPGMREMVRVTRRGGWIVALDTDWGSASIDSAETGIERRIARARAERWLPNGYAGRQLFRLFAAHGLADISVELHPLLTRDYGFARQAGVLDQVESEALAAGEVTEDELGRWRADLEKADAEGLFFGAVMQVLIAGRKP